MATNSIRVSTLPAVKAYLLATIEPAVAAANYSDPNVTVELSQVSDPENEDDFVVIGREVVRQTDVKRMVGGGGNHWMHERYTVSVSIQCTQAADEDFTQVDARAYALLGIVEGCVRADPGLGQKADGSALVIQAAPGRSTSESTYEPDHGGAMCVIESVIDVYAEL